MFLLPKSARFDQTFFIYIIKFNGDWLLNRQLVATDCFEATGRETHAQLIITAQFHAV